MTPRLLRNLFLQILLVMVLAVVAALAVGHLVRSTGVLGDRHPNWGWLVGALAGAAGASGCLFLLVVRRLRRLNAALVQAASSDDPNVEGLTRSGGELRLLAQGIDALVITLRRNYDELRVHDQLRRSMVANVSHELRTPLTNIHGYLETARGAGPESDDFEKNLDICLRETRKLSRLVQDLFQLSKLDNNQLEFEFESVPLVELVDQVGMAFEQRLADKQIAYETDFPDEEPLEVWGDGNRLGQVVQNLLGNAIVFTAPGGTLTLRCLRREDKAVIEVQDTGIGIPEKDIPHIFESFFHLEKSRTRNLGGTGLGLAICKAIVEKHEGLIEVESQVGEGTTFRVALPIAQDSEG